MAIPNSKVRIVFLSWLAFAGTFGLIYGLPFVWPWLRGVAKEDAAHVAVSMSGGAFCAGVLVGLAVRDYVQHRLGLCDGEKSSTVAKSGCLFIAVPASFVAFFCTCAPLGLLAGAESSVRPVERSWSNEIMIGAWVVGVVSAIVVARSSRHKNKS